MKILVVFTGGTIGSVADDGYISPSNQTTYQLIRMYRALKKQEVDFEYIEPYTLLSENLTGEYINKLGNCLREQIGKDYDGIIVTHGTDTVQYSAACMDYLFPDLQLPVMFVSSNYVLDDTRNNGLDNFTYAVQFITDKQNIGVFAVYRNSDRIVYVHKGNRLLPHLPYSDDLFSVSGQYYGFYAEDKFVVNPEYRVSSEKSACSLTLPENWNSNILRLFPYPGMEYPELTDRTKAVLMDSYHSGTICSVTPKMTDFFTMAETKEIPVFLTGVNNGDSYESVKVWKQLNVYTLPVASPIAMYVKLWMAMHSKDVWDGDYLNNIMQSSIAGDIIID